MSKKMSKMLDQIGQLITETQALQQNYTNCVNVLNMVSQDTNRKTYDLEMIRATELRMNQDHQMLCLELQQYVNAYNHYRMIGISPANHMDLLVLGENITHWADRYNAVVIGPAISLMSHIENAPLINA